MRDEEHPGDQVEGHGPDGPSEVADRMAPHRQLARVGTVLGVASVAAAVAAIATFPRFTVESSKVGWAVLALVCALVMTGICVVHLVAWRRAVDGWRGSTTPLPAPLARVSWWLHIGSYLVALVALYADISGSAAVGWSGTASTLLTVSLLLVLGAQVLGAVQYVRPSGPPGTIPTHLRRMLARERARQAAAAAIVERDGPGPR